MKNYARIFWPGIPRPRGWRAPVIPATMAARAGAAYIHHCRWVNPSAVMPDWLARLARANTVPDAGWPASRWPLTE